METINNVATAAAKIVWGEDHTQEPVSGEQGNTSKGEPFDAGNMEPNEQKRIETERERGVSSTDVTADSERPLAGKTTGKPENLGEHGDTTNTENKDKVSDKTGLDKEPKVDVQGPGPKSLDVVAREHGGDAGNINKPETTSSDSVDKNKAEHGEDKENPESTGTGEQYVKTSGLTADGGDFDATKPGAGREADRLMVAKSMHKEDPKAPTIAGATRGADSHGVDSHGVDSHDFHDLGASGKDKPSLGSRIKAKLHKH